MIRPATVADARALETLERDAFGSDAWSSGQIESELSSATRRVVVAEEDGRVIGYGVIAVAGDAADLMRIVVPEPNRRSGVASALLGELHRAAVQEGAVRMLLEVAASNSAALALYRARGYAEIARRRSYYASGGDALILERQLDGILDA
jgi:ribosomal-protein-alanine N-acetyltransferase